MKATKRIVILLMIFAIMMSMTSCAKFRVNDIFSCSIIDTDIDNYAERVADIKYASQFMPNLSDLNGYTNISYSYKCTLMGITFFIPVAEANSITLFVEYPDDIYKQKKAEVLLNYDFIEKELYRQNGEFSELITPLANFEYKGYAFKADVNEEYNITKSFVLIGCNDEANRIVYCYFYDPDLDCFARNELTASLEMNAFVDFNFEWNDIK